MPHGDMRGKHEQGTASGSWSWIHSKMEGSSEPVVDFVNAFALTAELRGTDAEGRRRNSAMSASRLRRSALASARQGNGIHP